jgi:uncharacterized protein with GYD domain
LFDERGTLVDRHASEGRRHLMDTADRMEHLRDEVHGRHSNGKLKDMQPENLRLKTEASARRGRVHDDRGDLSRRLSVIQRSNARRPRHRLRWIAMLAVAAAGGYVMGARAGRERYEEIGDDWRGLMGSIRSAVRKMQRRVAGVAEEAQSVGGRVSDAGQVIGETVHAIAEGPNDTDLHSVAANTSRSV